MVGRKFIFIDSFLFLEVTNTKTMESVSIKNFIFITGVFLVATNGIQAQRSPSKTFFEVVGLSERVVGGKPVSQGMFPWIVFIQANHKYKNNTQTSNLCGVSLMQERYAILVICTRAFLSSACLCFRVCLKGRVGIFTVFSLD